MKNLGYGLSHIVLAALVLLSSLSCAEQVKQIGLNKNDQVFFDASKMIGQHVTISGYLRWTFENKNLFPLWVSHNTPSQRFCLPVLINGTNKELLERASIFDGKTVTIDGVIAFASPPGTISVTNCKQVGIDVSSITKS